MKQVAFRFSSYDDLKINNCTIEEREGFEPLIAKWSSVYVGIDYEKILRKAEKEADVIVWDGGNHDTPFYKPDVHIVVFDPHRAGNETADTEVEGAMRVLEGTADAFVYDFPFNAVFSTMHPSDQLIFLDRPFTKEPIAWAIRKNDPDFMKFLNDFLDKIKADGRFDKMYNKWFNSKGWHRFVR